MRFWDEENGRWVNLLDVEAEIAAEIARSERNANLAARELLFLVAIEGIATLSRGGKGCVFRALEALRPDIAKGWADGEDPHDLLHEFFPEGQW